MHYRACDARGHRFTAVGYTVTFDDRPARDIAVRGVHPDMHDGLVMFQSGADPPSPEFGVWRLRADEAQPSRVANWRGAYPGRFAPDGTYYFCAPGTRTEYHYWREASGIAGPFPSGTSDIEGIGDFTADPAAPGGWRLTWFNRGHPLTVDGYRLPLWMAAGDWLYGKQGSGEGDRSIACDPAGHWWQVTTTTSPVFPSSLAVQTDGSLVVAWNGDKFSGASAFLSSSATGTQAWKRLTAVPPPAPDPLPVGECRFHACAMGGWTGTGPSFVGGTVAWSTFAYDNRLRVEGMPYVNELGPVPFWALIIGTESGHPGYPSKPAQIAATIAKARTLDVGVICYGDALNYQETAAPAMLAACDAAGVRGYIGQQFYAQADQSPAETEDAIDRQIREYAKPHKRHVVLVTTARDRFGKTLACAPLADKLIDQKFPSTIAGHLVFDGSGPGALSTVRHYWLGRWATMPPGQVRPL